MVRVSLEWPPPGQPTNPIHRPRVRFGFWFTAAFLLLLNFLQAFSLSYDLTSSSSPLLSLSLSLLSFSLPPSLFPSRLILPLPPHFPLVSLFFLLFSNPFYNILIVEVVLSAFPLVHYSRYRPPLDFRIPFQYSFALARPWPSAPFQF